jgi:hypothetical protein
MDTGVPVEQGRTDRDCRLYRVPREWMLVALLGYIILVLVYKGT